MWLCILIDVVRRWIRISFYQPIIQYCFSTSKALSCYVSPIVQMRAALWSFVLLGIINQATGMFIVNNSV